MNDALFTAGAVIDAVGGLASAAKLTGRGYTAAWNWKKAGAFPANTYLVMTNALAERGKSAPASLWGMVDPESAISEQESAA